MALKKKRGGWRRAGTFNTCLYSKSELDNLNRIIAQIEQLEEQIKEMEASFNQETPYQVYQEYEELLNQINLLYETWSGLVKQ